VRTPYVSHAPTPAQSQLSSTPKTPTSDEDTHTYNVHVAFKLMIVQWHCKMEATSPEQPDSSKSIESESKIGIDVLAPCFSIMLPRKGNIDDLVAELSSNLN